MEQDADRWCSYTPDGQELWQIASQWVWNLRLTLGQTGQATPLRQIEWSPIPDTLPATTPSLALEEAKEEEYGPFHWAGDAGRARGRFAASAFVRAARMGRCAVLLVPSSGAQEQRLVFCAPLEECQACLLREQCLGRGARGNCARRVSAVPHVSVKGRS